MIEIENLQNYSLDYKSLKSRYAPEIWCVATLQIDVLSTTQLTIVSYYFWRKSTEIIAASTSVLLEFSLLSHLQTYLRLQ